MIATKTSHMKASANFKVPLTMLGPYEIRLELSRPIIATLVNQTYAFAPLFTANGLERQAMYLVVHYTT